MAESFGNDAALYDRARPSYPDALVQRIVAESPGADVLDVGCGTGIAARQFQAAGCQVLGVEVDARMAEYARTRGLDVEVSKFEAWDPAGRTFDAVVAGQTWHWVEPDAGAVAAGRVLRPGGRLALFWNDGQPPQELAEAFAAVYRDVLPDSIAGRPRSTVSSGLAPFTDKAAEGIRRAGVFNEPAEWRHDWEREYTKDEWLDFAATSGVATNLAPATLDEVLTRIGAAVDAFGGRFTAHYVTTTVTAIRV